MNISTHGYVTRQSDPVVYNPESTLDADLKEHHAMLRKAGYHATGEVALIHDPDPEMLGTGVLQVWSKTDEGIWVWINPEGEALERACPVD